MHFYLITLYKKCSLYLNNCIWKLNFTLIPDFWSFLATSLWNLSKILLACCVSGETLPSRRVYFTFSGHIDELLTWKSMSISQFDTHSESTGAGRQLCSSQLPEDGQSRTWALWGQAVSRGVLLATSAASTDSTLLGAGASLGCQHRPLPGQSSHLIGHTSRLSLDCFPKQAAAILTQHPDTQSCAPSVAELCSSYSSPLPTWWRKILLICQ